MAAYFLLLVAACLAVNAAPPAQQHVYRQQQSAQLQQQISPYFLENEEANYYSQAQQKQENVNHGRGAPARLETLEPDSEVELINGGQQPQQPQPQAPPTLPGLAPGQRVFIVQMPVPGYRPGTIGGYQPVYIVAASPQSNGAGYPGNVFQNAVYLDQGQLVSPFVGYPRTGVQEIQRAPQDVNPGLVLGAPLLNRPFEFAYQHPSVGYQPGPVYQGANFNQVPVAQLISAQPQPFRPTASRAGNVQSGAQSQSLTQGSMGMELKEEQPTRNARPSPPHSSANEKA